MNEQKKDKQSERAEDVRTARVHARDMEYFLRRSAKEWASTRAARALGCGSAYQHMHNVV